jgi:hypothetical protein
MGLAFPLVLYDGAQWNLRFPSLWALAGSYASAEPVDGTVRFRAPHERSALERFVVDATLEDVTTALPALILVTHADDRVGPSGTHFDFLTYFLADPRFAAVFADFAPLVEVGPVRLFKRVGSVPTGESEG